MWVTGAIHGGKSRRNVIEEKYKIGRQNIFSFCGRLPLKFIREHKLFLKRFISHKGNKEMVIEGLIVLLPSPATWNSQPRFKKFFPLRP